MAKASAIGVRLEPEQRELIQRIAKAEDRTPSAVARRIIVEWLSKQERTT